MESPGAPRVPPAPVAVAKNAFASDQRSGLFVHYGAMAIAAFLVDFLRVMAGFRRRDRRFATWFAGLMAAYSGLASVAYPTNPSSVGSVGGASLFLWAVAFVAGVEYVRRSGSEREADASDGPVGRPTRGGCRWLAIAADAL